MPDPAEWELTLESPAAAPGASILARLDASLDEGWHLYSPSTPPPPIATTIELAGNPAVASYQVYQPAPIRALDPNFGVETETYEGGASFLIEIVLGDTAPAGASDLNVSVRYQVCNDTLCLRPTTKQATATLTVAPSASAAAVSIPGGFSPVAAPAETSAPATTEPATFGSDQPQGMFAFIGVAFGFGLAAIFTPCVFPMIPITMSFFLRRQTAAGPEDSGAGRGQSVIQAAVFCLGIIVLFTGLGLVATALLGPFGVVELGSNPWVNGFIAVVFLTFGLSLLGAFEFTLPSGVLTRLDRASGRGGYLGTLIMGLTFSLTAFACVGPFVGTLLAASVGGGGVRPLAGMLSFATGLAAPFFLLALFPGYLERLPRAGGWMSRVKVVLGFVVLAAMFKYLSNVDQVMRWEFLSRERFLAIWIALFSMAGLYLLGFLRLEGVDPNQKMGVSRLLIGGAFIAFALSLLPGVFGGRLGEIEAYVPPPRDGTGFLASSETGGLEWMKDQYEEALALARAENKLVFVNFTGYACTNCHWMKANMFTRPEIAAALKDYVLVDLYTDGTDDASISNQELQESKFQSIAMPYYAILDGDANVLATFVGLTRDPDEFLEFLRSPVGNG